MLPQRLSYRRVVVIGERLDLLRSKKPDELRGPDAALRVELQRSRRPVSSKATGFQSINKAGFLAVPFFLSQVLSGTIFALTFTFCCLAVGFTSDRVAKSAFGRHRLMAVGVLIFSSSCLLWGFSSAYWHLVILRVGIAAGESIRQYASDATV